MRPVTTHNISSTHGCGLAVALSLLIETADHVSAALELGVLADCLRLHHCHGPLTLADGHQVHAGRGDGEADHAVVLCDLLDRCGVGASQLRAAGKGGRRERGCRAGQRKGRSVCADVLVVKVGCSACWRQQGAPAVTRFMRGEERGKLITLLSFVIFLMERGRCRSSRSCDRAMRGGREE